MVRAILQLLVALVCSVVVSNPILAGNWPVWRGPHFNGVADGAGYPVEWSRTKNVAWVADLPGKSGSTPAVWDDRIFVTCADDSHNLLLCFDRSGKELWRREVGAVHAGKHKKGSGANPSPTTDGKSVFAYFKSGDFACFRVDGEPLWTVNLREGYGDDTLWWDLGNSPVLTENAVVVVCMQTGPSWLMALDKATGKELWKQDRNLGAPEEAAQSYSTPILVNNGERNVLVTVGADHVTGHDAASGKELWRVGGLNPTQHKYFRSIASPVVADGIVVAPYARGDSLTGIRLGGHGDVTRTHIVWEKHAEKSGADVPTPTARNGRAYVCTDRGTLRCLDIKSGDEIWSAPLEKNRNAYSSSPVIAAGNIYVTREDGATFVVREANEFEIVNSNTLDEFTVATPVFVDGSILIQTAEHLYCIRAEK